MSKATKIDANTWHYRGFTITADYHSPSSYRQCTTRQGFRIHDAPATAGQCFRFYERWEPSLAAAIEDIDLWHQRYAAGEYNELSSIPHAIKKALAVMFERGETTACP
jgi:hypothetical protein